MDFQQGELFPESDATLEQLPEDPQAAIATLEQHRIRLVSAGLSPEGALLETSKCFQRRGYQVYWRSDRPIFGQRKRRYVGMAGSAKAIAAQHSYQRRRQVEAIDRLLESLRQREEGLLF
jgi:hypothetical protein